MDFAGNFPPRDDKMDDLFFNQDNSVGSEHSSSSSGTGQDTDNGNDAGGPGRHKLVNSNSNGNNNNIRLSLPEDYPKPINLHQPDNTLDEAEMIANNHQSNPYSSTESLTTPATASSIGNNGGGHNSRYYNTYLLSSSANSLLTNPSSNTNYHQQQKFSNKYNNKYNHYSHSHYGKYAPNMFANNYNLNYIHSFLTNKPAAPGHSLSSQQASGLQTMQNLLNSNPNGLTLTSSYGTASLQQQALGSSSSVPSATAASGGGSISAQAAAAALSAAAAAANNHKQTIIRGQHQIVALKANGTAQSKEAEGGQQAQSHTNFTSSQTSGTDYSGYSPQCGRQQVAYREPRIVGGNSTYEGEFPWAVSIQRHGNHHCGGVIVAHRWILTAAHCVRSQLVGNLAVRTGGHTLTRSINSINSHLEKDFAVEQIIMHDDFSRYDNLTSSHMKSSATTNNADIALLRLKQDIHWNELAWPVCFPNRDGGNFSGHDAIAVGWGKLNEKSEEFSNELQKVKLTIIDNKVCQNWFRQAGRDMPIDDRIICAGFRNGGKDACHGDSGGPLLSRLNGQYVVVGVVSTGIGCARPLLPGLYSRVSSYIGWIERHINN